MPLRNDFFTRSRPFSPFDRIRFGTQSNDNEWADPIVTSSKRKRLSYDEFRNPAYDDFSEHISNMPREQDYSPSVWRRILAGVAGASTGYLTRDAGRAIKAAEDVNLQPYNRARDIWGKEGEALEMQANLSNAERKSRLDYMEYEQDIEDKEADRAVREFSANTQRFNAETAAKRAEFDASIRSEGNEIRRQQLINQKENWEKQNQQRESQLKIAERNAQTAASRAGAYRSRVDNLNARPNSSNINFTQQLAQKRMIGDEVKNMNPAWVDPATNEIKPEFRTLYEMEIQKRLNPRGDINLPPMGFDEDEEDEWVLEEP